jgi:hypothetical protein
VTALADAALAVEVMLEATGWGEDVALGKVWEAIEAKTGVLGRTCLPSRSSGVTPRRGVT